MRNEIFLGDWKDIARTLPKNSIDCIVTSPPYYGLRDYGVEGQEGQQETPEAFINSLVDGFRILRDALKDSGTLWVNMGDSYAGSGRGPEGNLNKGEDFRQMDGKHKPFKSDTIKPKDLIGVPWMLAFALRADGWYLRSDIIWHKPNPMPESVTDRPTKSHEYIFLLSKSSKYYYDAEAIKEESISNDSRRPYAPGQVDGRGNGHSRGGGSDRVSDYSKRNKRSVWTVTTKPFKDAHFACYPPDLIEPCIKAGTSEKGNCKDCGAPWVRIVESEFIKHENWFGDKQQVRNDRGEAGNSYNEKVSSKTVGWEKTCKCETNETVKPIVYDPFMGSGTTAEAATFCGCDYSGSELNPNYITIKNKRLHKKLGLFNQ
jgi:DNA modification methylase